MSSIYKQKISLWDWYEADVVSSTNDEIKNLISEKASLYIALSAKEQTNGRGRRGRAWQGKEGNLYITYSLKISPHQLSQLVCLIGLSLAKTVKTLGADKKVEIKWPNDVFLEGKKLSGILLENIKDDIWAIGLGVNITSAPMLQNSPYQATSLKDNGIMLDRKDFLRYYLENFAKDFDQYQTNGFATIKEQWLELALNYQQEIIVKTEKEEKKGTFAGLDDNGYLILQTKDRLERITAGDLFV